MQGAEDSKVARIWDDVIPPDDRAHMEQAGYGRRAGFGRRPAVLLVDLFVTDFRIVQNGQGFSDPFPGDGKASIHAVQALATTARQRGVPVFYSTNRYLPDGRDVGGWRYKSWTAEARAKKLAGRPYPFLEAVAPQPKDWIIEKRYPSVFFGTQLATMLIQLGVDTLLVGGQTTSGCVRATVIDAFSLGLRTSVVEECTYDRSRTSHKVNLFDMHYKYADVISLQEALEYLVHLQADANQEHGVRA